MTDARKELNSFSMGAVVGQIAMVSGAGPQTMTVKVDEDSTVIAGDIKGGMGVILVDGTSKVPEVDLCTTPETSTTPVYGIVVHNPKQDSYIASDILQIALDGSVIYMIAGASLARGVQVGLENPVSHSGISKVIAATNAPDRIGILLDKCIEDDLVRVQLVLNPKLPA